MGGGQDHGFFIGVPNLRASCALRVKRAARLLKVPPARRQPQS